jgi:DNA-binding response OmpR family regulator
MVDLNDHMILEPAAPERQVHLTPIEWQLLQALVRHPGRLVSQRQLLQEVWGPTYVDQTHYLRQYVKALRHKLEDDPARPPPPHHRARNGLSIPALMRSPRGACLKR